LGGEDDPKEAPSGGEDNPKEATRCEARGEEYSDPKETSLEATTRSRWEARTTQRRQLVVRRGFLLVGR
jgi:hypothetical protein